MELEYCYNGIVWTVIWDPNKAINIEKWLVCGDGRLVRFYYTYVNEWVQMSLLINPTCI